MLEEGETGKINVRELSRRAGLNHNTFYYHFGAIEDMESQLIDETIPSEIIPDVVRLYKEGRLRIGNIPFPEDALGRARKVKGILKNGSPSMRKKLEAKILSVWLDITGRSEETLSKKERVELVFLVNGFVGAFCELDFPNDLPLLERIANDALGKGYFETLFGLARAQHGRAAE